ncbi:MAG: zinc ribbon domain-containing protein [Lachnospiraceae bacterium]|nr:zinc ribbon domain-containing protein [Lachnospiraceae bacterium]
MDFFNKAKDSIVAASKGIGQKATDVSGLAKITVKIREEEKQLQAAISEMGARLFREKNAEAKMMFPELTEQIRKLYADLERDKVELVFLKGKKVCPNCGAELEADLQCCTSCGINVEHVERPSMIKPVCKNCGVELPDGTKFCQNCGTKVD